MVFRMSPSWMSLIFALQCSLENPVFAYNLACPRNGDTDSSTNLDSTDPNGQDFAEVSGLAFSPAQTVNGEPILYSVNDSGGGKRLGIFDSGTGERLLTLSISSLPSDADWESLAIGSCGIHGQYETCIYIADVGDNHARSQNGRSTNRGPYRIFKIREPLLENNYQDNEEIPADDTYVLEFDYLHPSSPTVFADCEAIFLDHTGWGGEIGDLYVVPKWNGRDTLTRNRLFQIPASAWAQDGTYSPIAVGTYTNGGDLEQETWMRADMTMDGTLIALGDGARTYLFPRCPGTSVAEALTGGASACHIWQNPFAIHGKQFETFAWTPDGSRNLQLVEMFNTPMGFTLMDYNNPAQTIPCPHVPTPAPSPFPTPSPSLKPSIVNPTQPTTLGGTPSVVPVGPSTLGGRQLKSDEKMTQLRQR